MGQSAIYPLDQTRQARHQTAPLPVVSLRLPTISLLSPDHLSAVFPAILFYISPSSSARPRWATRWMIRRARWTSRPATSSRHGTTDCSHLRRPSARASARRSRCSTSHARCRTRPSSRASGRPTSRPCSDVASSRRAGYSSTLYHDIPYPLLPLPLTPFLHLHSSPGGRICRDDEAG